MADRMWLNICLVSAALITEILANSTQIITKTQPTTLLIGDHSSLNVRCYIGGDASGMTSLTSISIDFKKTSSQTKQLARLLNGGQATISDPTLSPRAQVTGQIYTNLQSSYLTLDITKNVTCVDAGMYTCNMQFGTAAGSQVVQSSQEVQGTSNPSWKELIRNPLKDRYNINEVVAITCWGAVGKPARSWSWQLYDEEKSQWMPYTQDVTQTDALIISDCDFTRNSTLRYTVKTLDEVKLRCVLASDTALSIETSLNGQTTGASLASLSSSLVLLCVMLASCFTRR